jgi:hypothetical protein
VRTALFALGAIASASLVGVGLVVESLTVVFAALAALIVTAGRSVQALATERHMRKRWRPREDSNLQPQPSEGCALSD